MILEIQGPVSGTIFDAFAMGATFFLFRKVLKTVISKVFWRCLCLWGVWTVLNCSVFCCFLIIWDRFEKVWSQNKIIWTNLAKESNSKNIPAPDWKDQSIWNERDPGTVLDRSRSRSPIRGFEKYFDQFAAKIR